MRRFLSILLIFVMAAALTGCGSGVFGKGEPQKFSGYVFEAFDTVIGITAYCESQKDFDRLMDTAQADFIRCHQLFDIYNTYPDMNNLRSVNDSAGQHSVEVSREIIDLLLFSRDMYALTEGRVNVAMGSVLSIWHNAREYNNSVAAEEAYLPDMAELLKAAELCGMDCVMIDEKAGTVFLTEAGMSLDVGAVAKGYATELVARHLIEQGFECFVINAGGNVRCCGAKPGGASWNVAVTNPGLSGYGESIGTVSVPGGSIVTSGSYQRFFIYEGRRYHHIIDPETLMPEDRYLSVTVIAEDSGYADALSTSLFNMDIDEGLELANSLDGVEAMWVLSNGEMVYSESFQLNN